MTDWEIMIESKVNFLSKWKIYRLNDEIFSNLHFIHALVDSETALIMCF